MSEDTLTARNRINQRNFRARRQNYIRDLEDRLRKYEHEGVQATIEIQTAARQVTEQNLKLRNLLNGRFGMPDHEIEAYLGTDITTSTTANLFAIPSGAVKSFSEQTAKCRPLIASHPDTYTQIDRKQLISPALGLASLHMLSEQDKTDGPPAKRPRAGTGNNGTMMPLASDHSVLKQGSMYETLVSVNTTEAVSCQLRENDPDTLSESSNPQTPSERQASHTCGTGGNGVMLSRQSSSNTRTTSSSSSFDLVQPPSLKTDTSTISSTATSTPTAPTFYSSVHGDETTCEDAARIIASMRGTDARPEQILLELGCAPSPIEMGDVRVNVAHGMASGNKGIINGKGCKVKNLSIFNLMDR